jgi:transposase
MKSHNLNYNYYALAVAIIKNCSPERAFALMEGRAGDKPRKLSDEEIEEMIQVKKTHTYDEMAKIYGMSRDAIYMQIKRYKQRKGVV